MPRPLLACALLLALLGAALTVWLALGGPLPADEAAPGQRSVALEDRPSALQSTATDSQREATLPEPLESESGPAGSTAGSAGFALEVAVADPDGAAVGSARVTVSPPDGPRATTDGRGLARLELRAGTHSVELRVEAEGYAHLQQTFRVASRIEVTLHPALTLRGRVVERGTLAPIPGASVWIDDRHQGCQLQRADAADDGSFELAGAPLGMRFEVAATAEGFADSRVPFQLFDRSATDAVEIALERSAGVRLRIVDFQSGRPVAGARLLEPAGVPPADENGILDASRLAAESATSAWILVAAPGYCVLGRHVLAAEWVGGGIATVPLLAGARFEGLVRGSAGAPLPGARLTLAAQDRAQRRPGAGGATPQLQGWQWNWQLRPEASEAVESDAGGRFVTPAIPPAMDGWELVVSAEGHATARIAPLASAAPGQSTWLEVELQPSAEGTITGRLSLNGEPIAGEVTWAGATATGRGGADPTGRFRLEGVEPGQVTLTALPIAAARQFGSLFEGQLVRLDLPVASALEQDIDLTLPLARTSGHVRTPRGLGVAGVKVVALLGELGAVFETTSIAEGRFELELPDLPQPWTLQARGPWSTEAVEARAGSRGIVLVVTELGQLLVRMVDAAGGRPIREYLVRASTPGQAGERVLASTWQNTPDPAGWIQLEAPSGALDLAVSPLDRSYPAVMASIVVPSAGAPPLRLELATARGSTLNLVLAEDSDRPPRLHQAYLVEEEIASRLPTEASQSALWQALVDATGNVEELRRRHLSFDMQRRTTLLGLPDGRYRLLDLSGGRFEPAQVELPRDGRAPVSVSWDKAP